MSIENHATQYINSPLCNEYRSKCIVFELVTVHTRIYILLLSLFCPTTSTLYRSVGQASAMCPRSAQTVQITECLLLPILSSLSSSTSSVRLIRSSEPSRYAVMTRSGYELPLNGPYLRFCSKSFGTSKLSWIHCNTLDCIGESFKTSPFRM